MRRFSILSALTALSSMTAQAGALGGGIGYFTSEIDHPKIAQPTRWSVSAPMWSFKYVDPSGSLLSFLGTAAGNYGRMAGAQAEAEKKAKENNGYGTASYEMKTSVNSTGSTQTLEILWAHGGSIDYTDAAGKVVDDNLDNLTLQASLSENITAWNGIAGTPVSVVPYWKMIMGYFDFAGVGKFNYPIEESQAWFTFPVGAAVVFDAPLRISAKAFAGYDPITGIVSIWSKNVHQAWEYGVGAEWAPLPWLVAETSFTAASSNIDNQNVWAFGTTALNFGARIDFDGF